MQQHEPFRSRVFRLLKRQLKTKCSLLVRNLETKGARNFKATINRVGIRINLNPVMMKNPCKLSTVTEANDLCPP